MANIYIRKVRSLKKHPLLKRRRIIWINGIWETKWYFPDYMLTQSYDFIFLKAGKHYKLLFNKYSCKNGQILTEEEYQQMVILYCL